MKMMFIGLGLIGGSMALALRGYPGLECYAVDLDDTTRFEALGQNAVRACWKDIDTAPLEEMDVIVLCLHPRACAKFIAEHASRISEGKLLTDVCGVKQPLADAIAALPEKRFTYLGGHPMAGRECGGFHNAKPDLFRGAHYILTPDESTPAYFVKLMESFATFIGCSDVVISNPKAHDALIGYTSQLMHVMALALCDQHLLYDSHGFEGGSFRGATRVAALEPRLWCELFYANRETLANLTDELIEKLAEYSALLHQDDYDALLARLTSSSDRKKEFDRLRSPAPSGTPLFK